MVASSPIDPFVPQVDRVDGVRRELSDTGPRTQADLPAAILSSRDSSICSMSWASASCPSVPAADRTDDAISSIPCVTSAP